MFKNMRGEVALGTFLVLFFLLMVAGKVIDDTKDNGVAPIVESSLIKETNANSAATR